MIRRIFTLASVVSLLLCAATVGLCVRSFWVEDCVRWIGQQSRGELKPCPPRLSAFATFCYHGKLCIGVNIQKNTGADEESGGWFYEKNPTIGFSYAANFGDALFDRFGLGIRRH